MTKKDAFYLDDYEILLAVEHSLRFDEFRRRGIRTQETRSTLHFRGPLVNVSML